MRREQRPQAFIASGLGVAGVILTAGASIFPFIILSSTHVSDSLTVWNATSSRSTLQIMLIAVLIFLTIVLLYTTWVYRVMRGRVSIESTTNDSSPYKPTGERACGISPGYWGSALHWRLA